MDRFTYAMDGAPECQVTQRPNATTLAPQQAITTEGSASVLQVRYRVYSNKHPKVRRIQISAALLVVTENESRTLYGNLFAYGRFASTFHKKLKRKSTVGKKVSLVLWEYISKAKFLGKKKRKKERGKKGSLRKFLSPNLVLYNDIVFVYNFVLCFR